MTIGIIYCETLKSEILTLAEKVPEISHLESMAWGLHIEPDKLLAEVSQQIKLLQNQVDVIILGYGAARPWTGLVMTSRSQFCVQRLKIVLVFC